MIRKLGWANIITLCRLGLVLVLNTLLVVSQGQQSLIYVVVGLWILNGIGDIVDGYFARRLNQVTQLGAILDVIADGILVLGAYFILAFKGIIGYCLFYVGFFKYFQFLFDSYLLRRSGKTDGVLTYDFLGHWTSILLQWTLILHLLVPILHSDLFRKYIYSMDILITALCVIAAMVRVKYYFGDPKPSVSIK